MLTNREALRGAFLIVIALAFGIQALRYPIGQIALAGPGMFPLVVSSLLGTVGVAMVIRSYFTERVALAFNVRNIGVIIGSLAAFPVISLYVNMISAIVFLVFFASIAGRTYSVVRNIKVAACLVAIAFVFQRVFSLELHLY